MDDQWVISSGDNHLTKLDIESGNVVWKTEFDHTGPLQNRGIGHSENIFVGSIPDKIIGWNQMSGKQEWMVPVESPNTLFTLGEIQFSGSSFIVSGNQGEIYFISENGLIVDTQVSKYRVYQTTTVGNGLLLLGQRTYDEDNFNGAISLIDINSGIIKWEFKPEGFAPFIRMPPTMQDGIVYCGTMGSSGKLKQAFFALDANTGEEIWRREGIFTYSAVLVGDYIYVNNATGIYKLRKTDGGIEWYSNFRAGVGTSPIAYGYGYLYAPHAGTMHVVDAGNGEIVHRFSPPDGSYFWRVTAGAGRIFAQSNRTLYAFAPWGHTQPLED